MIQAPEVKEMGDGFVPKVDEWRREVDWAEVVVFDDVLGGMGTLAQELRQAGKAVVGGSPYTDRLEEEAEKIFADVDRLGGVVPGIEAGYFQREIARSAFRQQREIENVERVIVGVNDFTIEGEEIEIPLLKVTEESERRQRERMAAMRARRDQGATRSV